MRLELLFRPGQTRTWPRTARRRTSGQTPIAIRAAIEFFGIEHVMLGSDAPFAPLANHLATLAQLNLSDADRAFCLQAATQSACYYADSQASLVII